MSLKETPSSCPPQLQTLPRLPSPWYGPLSEDRHVVWSLSTRKTYIWIHTLCSDKKWSKILSSNLTIVSLQWSVCFYFLSTSDCRSLCLVYVFTIILSRNLPIFVYHAFLFQNISHATSIILNNCSSLISLVFVPCPLSLPIYKITIYIGIEKEPSNEY